VDSLHVEIELIVRISFIRDISKVVIALGGDDIDSLH